MNQCHHFYEVCFTVSEDIGACIAFSTTNQQYNFYPTSIIDAQVFPLPTSEPIYVSRTRCLEFLCGFKEKPMKTFYIPVSLWIVPRQK